MHKERLDKIKQDEADLQKLQLQIEKVEKLKKDYAKQKQEIVELKIEITQLKSENDQLKSQSALNQGQKSTHKQQKLENFSNSGQQQLNKISKVKQKLKNLKLKSQQRENYEQEINQQQSRTRSKLWNNNVNRQKRRQRQLNKYNQLDNNQDQIPTPSMRNYSGFISSTYTGRLLSPQTRNQYNQGTLRGRKCFNQTQGWQQHQNDPRFESNFYLVKNKLVDNLVADLSCELQQKQEQIKIQRSNHKQTKKTLKKTLGQNQRLSQVNSKLFSGYQLLQKQNQYLKQQLMKQTEGKYKAQSMNQDFLLWHNTIAKRCYQQFQIQFLAMDSIYFEFQRICNSKFCN